MRRVTRRAMGWLFAVVLVAAATPALAQRGIPPTPFGTADLDKLRWIEGYWRGTATGDGAPPVYERLHFANDSTIEITYYADSTFTRATGEGRVFASVGRVFQTSGGAVWGAAHVGKDGAYFIPQKNVSDTFAWTYESPTTWKTVQRTSATGQERVKTYEMVRIRQ
jgi:hypothetical protein